MAVNPDIKDLFAVLNAAGAKYLLVGGYAVSFHAQTVGPRASDVERDDGSAQPAGDGRSGAP